MREADKEPERVRQSLPRKVEPDLKPGAKSGASSRGWRLSEKDWPELKRHLAGAPELHGCLQYHVSLVLKTGRSGQASPFLAAHRV